MFGQQLLQRCTHCSTPTRDTHPQIATSLTLQTNHSSKHCSLNISMFSSVVPLVERRVVSIYCLSTVSSCSKRIPVRNTLRTTHLLDNVGLIAFPKIPEKRKPCTNTAQQQAKPCSSPIFWTVHCATLNYRPWQFHKNNGKQSLLETLSKHYSAH